MRIATSLARGVVLLVVSTAYVAYVFQWSTRAFATAGPGDWLDPYFINGLLEHWYWSVTHGADPTSPLMYFPVRGTLGYSHGLILYAPFYILVRPFLHPFQAHVLTLLLVIQTGVVCLYLIFRRHLKLGFLEALALTAFFLTSRNVIDAGSGNWSQRLSVFLVPPTALLMLTAFRTERARSALAFCSGLVSMLLFAQDFYPAAFVVMLSCLFLAGLLPLTRGWRDMPAELARRFAAPFEEVLRRRPRAEQPKPGRWWWISGLGLLAWSAVLFMHPVERMQVGPLALSARHPGRPLMLAAVLIGWWVFRTWTVTRQLEQIVRRPPRLKPLASAVTGSRLGRLVATWWLAYRQIALPVVAGALVGMLIFLWIYIRSYLEHPTFPQDQLITALRPITPGSWRRWSDASELLDAFASLRPFELMLLVSGLTWVPLFGIERRTRVYAAWCAFASVIVLLLPLRIGEISIWTVFLKHLPGLSVVRDPKRVIEVFELFAVLLVGLLLVRLARRSILRISILVLVCGLIVQDRNLAVFEFLRSDRVFDQWVEAPIAVDRTCRSFFVRGASQTYMTVRPGHMWSLYGVDSLFIAMRYGIPTLNGYSAWAPETWQLANPQETGYIEAVNRWIAQNSLTNVCVLDIDGRTMTPYVAGTMR